MFCCIKIYKPEQVLSNLAIYSIISSGNDTLKCVFNWTVLSNVFMFNIITV